MAAPIEREDVTAVLSVLFHVHATLDEIARDTQAIRRILEDDDEEETEEDDPQS